MPVPAPVQPVPSASPAPLTPKAKSATLESRPGDLDLDGGAHSNGAKAVSDDEGYANGHEPDTDGRMTPMPESSSSASRQTSVSASASASASASSFPSPFTAVSSRPSDSASFHSLPVPLATVGYGALEGESQLKLALAGKDRMFLLVLSKEIEAFISRLPGGGLQTAAEIVPGGTTSNSVLAMLGASTLIGAVPTSKFQRMLVYKAAEWYGLKACAGIEQRMIVGVLGTLMDKSPSLRLADLVPRPTSPAQKFKIMQRANDGPINRSTSTDTTSTTSGSGSNAKKALTLEEREAAYALARERIIGPAVDDPPSDAPKTATFSSSSSIPSSASVSESRQEDDTISRPAMEPIYPSLSHPPRQETLPIPDRQQLPPIFPPYGYSDGNHFFPPPPPPPTHNVPQQGYAGQPYPSQLGPMPYGGQPYEPPQPGYMSTQAYNPQGWSQFPGQPMMPDPSQSLPVPAQGWVYLNTNGQPPIPQRMPMIPQGIPAYHQPYAYPPPAQAVQQNNYPQLAHPAPQRPPIHPHSSASSSISSMSYQDWSRPHSRGSTTSTRSATSSIRLGQRYQVGPSQPGFGRQKPPKTQGINGLTSLGLGDSRRSTRGHSPSSATTASSRSSRRTGSIPVALPAAGQHPLPQRPDWAAKNVPYHPSPLPVVGQPGHPGQNGVNTSDFPPLQMAFRGGTQAEPMQVERVKMRPPSQAQSVWTGAPSRVLSGTSVIASPSGVTAAPLPASATPEVAPSRTPAPVLPSALSPAPVSPVVSTIQPVVAPTTAANSVAVPINVDDPEFPRRVPSKPAQSLFDPSAPRPSSRPSSAAGTIRNLSLTTDDAIEARLQAVSISANVSIGPPKSSSTTTGSVVSAIGPAPSYAKIVRRE